MKAMEFTKEAKEFLITAVVLNKIPLKVIERGMHPIAEAQATAFAHAMAIVGLVELFGYSHERVLQLGSPEVVSDVFFRMLDVMGYLEPELEKAEVIYDPIANLPTITIH